MHTQVAVPLPATTAREAGREGVGFAAHLFHEPQREQLGGWIAGFLDLPPGAIKVGLTD
jgi:hypothetical protein